MKALTVRQPWAFAIAHLGKRVENRVWGTTYRGDLAIHAASIVDTHGVRLLRDMGFWLPELPTGIITSVVHLDKTASPGIIPVLPPWGEPSAHLWYLSDVRNVDAEITVIGHQKLWDLPRDDELAVLAVLEAQRG